MSKKRMPLDMAFAQCVDLMTQLLEKYGDDILTEAEKKPDVHLQSRKPILQTKRLKSYFKGWNSIANKNTLAETDS